MGDIALGGGPERLAPTSRSSDDGWRMRRSPAPLPTAAASIRTRRIIPRTIPSCAPPVKHRTLRPFVPRSCRAPLLSVPQCFLEESKVARAFLPARSRQPPLASSLPFVSPSCPSCPSMFHPFAHSFPSSPLPASSSVLLPSSLFFPHPVHPVHPCLFLPVVAPPTMRNIDFPLDIFNHPWHLKSQI